MKIQVIVGSTRQGRYGDKPARWIHEQLGSRCDAELLDLRDWPIPYYDFPTSPARMGRVYPNEVVQRWSKKIDEGDGYVVTVAEYNHGYTAVLKSALDAIFPEWSRKPIAFVAYGGQGGARAVEQLRQVAVEFEMAPIQQAVHIPVEVLRASRPVPYDAAHFAPLKEKADAMIAQLLWWADALKTARAKS